MRGPETWKSENVKTGKCVCGKKCKKFSIFLDVFQNGSIYKVKGTKETFNYLFKYIYKIQRRVLL